MWLARVILRKNNGNNDSVGYLQLLTESRMKSIDVNKA